MFRDLGIYNIASLHSLEIGSKLFFMHSGNARFSRAFACFGRFSPYSEWPRAVQLLWNYLKLVRMQGMAYSNKLIRKRQFLKGNQASTWNQGEGCHGTIRLLKASVYWRTRSQFWKLNQVQLFWDQNKRKPIRLLLLNARACDRTGSFARPNSLIWKLAFREVEIIIIRKKRFSMSIIST